MGKARKLKELRSKLIRAAVSGHITPGQASDVYRIAKGRQPKSPPASK